MIAVGWAVAVLAGGLLLIPRDGGPARDRVIARHISDVASMGSGTASISVDDARGGRSLARAIRAAASRVQSVIRSVVRRRRVTAARDELPVMLDFAVLCLTAGLGVMDTVARLARIGDGVIAGECRRIVASHDLGVSVGAAFDASARRVPHDGWVRVLSAIREAMERGTPVAAVVSAIAIEERESAARRLIESGSTREVAMMVPLVFVILPVTVIFAVYPGLSALTL